MFTETLTQRQALAFAAPQTINANATATIYTGATGTGSQADMAGINMSMVRRARVILALGSVAGGSVTLGLLAGTTVGTFANYAAITGPYTVTGGTSPFTFPVTLLSTANQLYTVEIRADQMPAGRPYLVATALQVGGNAVLASLMIVGDEAAYKPGSAYNVGTTMFAAVNSSLVIV